MVSWAHPSQQPKLHLDRFSLSARLTIVTDRQTTLLRLYQQVASTYYCEHMLPRVQKCFLETNAYRHEKAQW